MGKQPFISHAVNGYSRYDVPESKAFSCTPGILYPVRIDFINARDRVTISQGIDVRSNPLAVPSFNPYTVRLHRFWVPMQLYHPEMRTNSSKFDMNNVSLNWIPASVSVNNVPFGLKTAAQSSLLSWLRITNGQTSIGVTSNYYRVALDTSSSHATWVSADSYLAYWDIVRNYYSYCQWSLYSVAWPGSWSLGYTESTKKYSFTVPTDFGSDSFAFAQDFCDLRFLDSFYETQFYPSSVISSNGTYNRGNLFLQIVRSQQDSSSLSADYDPYHIPSISEFGDQTTNVPNSLYSTTFAERGIGVASPFVVAHPMAVVPSNPDRFSRLLPSGTSDDVSMSGVTTIPQLAIASRLQEYKDLLGAGGSRYSDWLETFFASRIEHVDRPKLLFSASQTVNVQVVMNQAGYNNMQGSSYTQPLGQQGGSIAFNTQLGRRQSYYFREPGYMIDMLSIRPVYYWSGIRPDYLNYLGSDYFNPIYNDIGYQDVPGFRFGVYGNTAPSEVVYANEPCFNEFRASYDEALGSLSAVHGATGSGSSARPLYAYWVQQRGWSFGESGSAIRLRFLPFLFVDMTTVNSQFASNVEDNFFVNLSYSVVKKNLVNKTFATRLSNR